MKNLFHEWPPGAARREATRRLEEQLRRQAQAIPVRPTDALHRSIMAGVASERVVPIRHPVRPLWAAALAALLVAGLGLWLTRPPPAVLPPVSVPDLAALTVPIPETLVGRAEIPLDRETAALKSDVLSAGQYLLELTGI
jgi:hypothetical protein